MIRPKTTCTVVVPRETDLGQVSGERESNTGGVRPGNHDRSTDRRDGSQRDPRSQCALVVPQLRQTWAYDQPQRFLIFDRDAKFSADVVATVEDYGMRPMRTALRSPWQNGIAERWVGKRASRPTGPRDCSEAEAFEEVDEKLHPLLSRRSEASRTR